MDGEVIHPLFGLLDQRVAEDLPGEIGGDAADLFERLVDRHRADGHRRIADDPFPDVVDVAARGQVHHRVRAPAGGPDHLLHLLGHRRGDGGIADIGVDLDQEVAADGHRLGFGMVDVGRDDGAPARHLVAHELGRDEIGDVRAEGLAVTFQRMFRGLAAEVLADRDELHLRRDDPGAGIGHLGDGPAILRLQRRVAVGEFRRQTLALGKAIVLGLHMAALIALHIAAARDPVGTQARQAVLDGDLGLGVGVGAGTVIDGDRRLARRRVQVDRPHRHADLLVPFAGLPDPARGRQRPGGDGG